MTEGFPFSCGDRTRTYDLWVMSPTSYHCSTPRYSRNRYLITAAKIGGIFLTSKFIYNLFVTRAFTTTMKPCLATI